MASARNLERAMAGEPRKENASADELFRSFAFEKLINQDARLHTINLLGTVQLPGHSSTSRVPALALFSKTHFDAEDPNRILPASERIKTLGSNDVYHWMLGWGLSETRAADWKVTIIAPASDVHIHKYSAQKKRMVRETPQLYKDIVVPYIEAFPPSRINWVYNILDHKTESEQIIFEDPGPQNGFLIIPDLKWDQRTLSSLYLLALPHDRTLRSLRDLRPRHLGLLRSIEREVGQAAGDRYGVAKGELRMFVHYQPSYYHLHVHVTHVDHLGFDGIAVGQSHLLQDVIDALEQDLAASQSSGARVDDANSFFARKTFTYALGDGHALYEPLTRGSEADETTKREDAM